MSLKSLFLRVRFYTSKDHLFKRYFHEILLENDVNISKSDQRSVLYFTVHRCASTFLASEFDKILPKGMIHINFDSYFSGTDNDKYANYRKESFMKKVFYPQGYFYGPFREFIEVPDMDKYKIILMIRDPRDVLTSHYYSTAFSHPLLHDRLRQNREKALKQSVDGYVKEYMHRFQETYSKYLTLKGKPNVCFLKYEDMILDYEKWLRRVIEFLELDVNENKIKAIARESKFTVSEENKFAHKRNVSAGDYENKLTAETINTLNSVFEQVLKTFDY